MRRNPDFILREIANESYILPMGQAMSDHKRGIKTNETGMFLWNCLKEETSESELSERLCEYYGAKKSEQALLKKDIHAFLSELANHGMLLLSEPVPGEEEPYYKKLSIAGFALKLFGPPEAFSDHFAPFYSETEEKTAQKIIVLLGVPATNRGGTLILRNRELTIVEQDDRFLLLFPSSPGIFEMHLKKDGSLATLYVKPPLDEQLREDIFHALRFAFLLLASGKQMVAVHSASVLYKEKAWLFSARAQTGKTTHAGFWNDLFHAEILNGDLNLIGLNRTEPLVFGTPWCGTSGICDTKTRKLGGIILLKQGKEDLVEELPEDKRRLLVLQRIISPSFHEELFDRNLRLVDKIASRILICRLHCTPTPHAAQVMKEAVDKYLDEKECHAEGGNGERQ